MSELHDPRYKMVPGTFNPDGGSLGPGDPVAPFRALIEDIRYYHQDGRIVFEIRNSKGEATSGKMAFLIYPVMLKMGLDLTGEYDKDEPATLDDKARFLRFIHKVQEAADELAKTS